MQAKLEIRIWTRGRKKLPEDLPEAFEPHVAMPGPHLGRRVNWKDLPPDVQSFARQSFPAFAPSEAA